MAVILLQQTVLKGHPKILGDGRWGILVPCNDRRALTKAILESLNSKPNRELLIKRAMEFTPNRIFPQYENLINAVISKQYPQLNREMTIEQ